MSKAWLSGLWICFFYLHNIPNDGVLSSASYGKKSRIFSSTGHLFWNTWPAFWGKSVQLILHTHMKTTIRCTKAFDVQNESVKIVEKGVSVDWHNSLRKAGLGARGYGSQVQHRE